MGRKAEDTPVEYPGREPGSTGQGGRKTEGSGQGKGEDQKIRR